MLYEVFRSSKTYRGGGCTCAWEADMECEDDLSAKGTLLKDTLAFILASS
jgi:hypothetical protein